MRIISFEGIEGVGKSTQIELLKNYIQKNNYTVEVLREPGSTETGEMIREILLNNHNPLANQTELLLMFAARSELVKHKINNSNYDFLLLDRFYDASIAYQGYGRGLPISFIESLITFIDCPVPELTILLDTDVDKGFLRKENEKKDRIESSGTEFFNNVRNGYLQIASEDKKRFMVLNALDEIKNIHNKILKKLNI
ncbi:MAG: dTMP kinase [Gammaproteobacteria bacterium]|nr:dTMP kinase [Gammaproteobacteria bacterium]|tara:strand:- start:573 stop:1163 length:591 start_codon:yes stop_codon:yes gene_type:complete